jgi:HK97 family phage prohead protease
MKREIRRVTVGIEHREENGEQVLVGRPIVYNSDSLPIYGVFIERIRPGAFDRCLSQTPDILCLRDHKAEYLLGRTSNETLKIATDERGIAVECKLPRTTYALDLYESVKRKDISGMSFGFDVLSDDWYLKDGKRYRDVIEGELFEVTFTSQPAYPDTEASTRDVESFKREVEARFAMSERDKLRNRLRYLAHPL